MKIGIISDIHSNILALEAVFNKFKEENVKRNKTTRSSFIATERVTENKAVHKVESKLKIMKEISKIKKFSEMRYSF